MAVADGSMAVPPLRILRIDGTSMPHSIVAAYDTAVVLQITFTISADNILSVDATDLDSRRHYTWQTTGGALIANGVNAAMLRDGVLPYSTLSGTQVSPALR